MGHLRRRVEQLDEMVTIDKEVSRKSSQGEGAARKLVNEGDSKKHNCPWHPGLKCQSEVDLNVFL